MFFWSHPRCFGRLGKFQHNIKIFIKTARVSRLSVSYDYVDTKYVFFLEHVNLRVFQKYIVQLFLRKTLMSCFCTINTSFGHTIRANKSKAEVMTKTVCTFFRHYLLQQQRDLITDSITCKLTKYRFIRAMTNF